MGSLSSTPKVPQQQVVFVPAPTSTQRVSTPEVEDPSSVPDPDAVAAEAREKSLLSRRRGRFGTIATSFQGLLGEVRSGARKTLLGE